MKSFKTILTTILFCLPFICQAQLVLTDNYLHIGTKHELNNLNFSINGYPELIWKFKSHDFNIDLNGSTPRIGTSQKFYFRMPSDPTIYLNITFNRLFVCSDANLKTNIVPYGKSLGIINSIRVKNLIEEKYSKNSIDNANIPSAYIDTKSLSQHLPSLVIQNDSMTSVNYIGLIPVMLKAIKELKHVVEKQANLITELQSSK